jgi:hypothetical protein
MKWTCWGVALWLTVGVAHAGLPTEWKYLQKIEVTQPGLVKLSLPVETLGAARAGLEDLRIYDPAGAEVPYLLEKPTRPEKIVRQAKKFDVTLTGDATIINLETGLAQPIEGITLETAARQFIKAVRIEGSVNQQDWQSLAAGQPVFRQPYGGSQLHLQIPPGVWPFLRLTLDDRRSEPVTFAGAEIQAAAKPTPLEPLPVTITERREDDHQTRLTLNLGAAHLTPALLRIETGDPLFMRQITAAAPAVAENEISERPLASGTIYRVAVEGVKVSADLTLPLDRQVNSRELLLLIDNRDNPPLQITAIGGKRHPVYATFFCQHPGAYSLLIGNPQAPAPRYDLAALASSLREAPVSPATVTALAGNPSYQRPETLPEIQDLGTKLDLSEWKFRKLVQIKEPGVIKLDLDLETLAGAEAHLRDLRLVRDGKQQPYLLERTSSTDKFTPEVQPDPDPKHPSLSRWRLKLPYPRLPVTGLTCTTRTPLFKRDIRVYEQPQDQRGEPYHRLIARTTWVRRPPAAAKTLEIPFTQAPLTDRLILETDNGDNPPVELDNFQLSYRITRLLFKAPTSPETYLYYGNRDIGVPRYDITLMAPELLASEKAAATLGPEERLTKVGWGETLPMTRLGSILFWAALGLVVVVLLFVMARLLPKNPPAA